MSEKRACTVTGEDDAYLRLMYMLLHSQKPLPMTSLRVVAIKYLNNDTRIQQVQVTFDNGETFSFTRPLP